jgi:sterol desaturase/sphingolipid hydroxylase (fatty acid hydroxylase superfamily)
MDTIRQYWGLIDHHFDGIVLSAVLIALFTAAEVRWPASRYADVRSRIVNIVIGLIVSVFAFLCTVLIAWFATIVWRGGLIGLALPGWRGSGIAGLIISVVAYGMVWDFFQYWFHRWQHVSPALWPTHRVHHSDENVNTTTALRRSVLELFLIFVFVLVPTMIVAGVDEIAAPIAFAVFYGWGFFNHANIRLPLGPLTAMFSGPQWHRLHHAIDSDCRDRNFAAYFPILDIVFGTYRPPRQDEYLATGVTDPTVSAHPFRDCLLPGRVEEDAT